MRLYEHVANRIFSEAGIPMAGGYVISSPDDIKDFENKVVLKAQVLTGGRGKAGGIKLASDTNEAKTLASELLGSTIKDLPVTKVFVQNAFDINAEYYLSITVDRQSKQPVLLFSVAGGVDIESTSENVIKIPIDPLIGLDESGLKSALGSIVDDVNPFATIIKKLYDVFLSSDATLAEINPLALTSEGLVGLDAKIIIDDNSLFRHEGLKAEELLAVDLIEREAEGKGLSYVSLDGDIGVIGCGAGLVMASLDAIEAFGGKPANFLDVGGGASQETIEAAIDLVLKKPGVKSIFINMFAGITRCDEIAKAIIAKKHDVNFSIRLVGTLEDEGKKILANAGFDVFDSMDDAAKNAVEALR